VSLSLSVDDHVSLCMSIVTVHDHAIPKAFILYLQANIIVVNPLRIALRALKQESRYSNDCHESYDLSPIDQHHVRPYAA
jgi:hypothetical protein